MGFFSSISDIGKTLAADTMRGVGLQSLASSFDSQRLSGSASEDLNTDERAKLSEEMRENNQVAKTGIEAANSVENAYTVSAEFVKKNAVGLDEMLTGRHSDAAVKEYMDTKDRIDQIAAQGPAGDQKLLKEMKEQVEGRIATLKERMADNPSEALQEQIDAMQKMGAVNLPSGAAFSDEMRETIASTTKQLAGLKAYNEIDELKGKVNDAAQNLETAMVATAVTIAAVAVPGAGGVVAAGVISQSVKVADEAGALGNTVGDGEKNTGAIAKLVTGQASQITWTDALSDGLDFIPGGGAGKGATSAVVKNAGREVLEEASEQVVKATVKDTLGDIAVKKGAEIVKDQLVGYGADKAADAAGEGLAKVTGSDTIAGVLQEKQEKNDPVKSEPERLVSAEKPLPQQTPDKPERYLSAQELYAQEDARLAAQRLAAAQPTSGISTFSASPDTPALSLSEKRAAMLAKLTEEPEKSGISATSASPGENELSPSLSLSEKRAQLLAQKTNEQEQLQVQQRSQEEVAKARPTLNIAKLTDEVAQTSGNGVHYDSQDGVMRFDAEGLRSGSMKLVDLGEVGKVLQSVVAAVVNEFQAASGVGDMAVANHDSKAAPSVGAADVSAKSTQIG